ncbi:hypothetical protein PIB30_090394 [Stylosanthes scabra]|uniref:Transposase n=1 Tax=Stylosanthes scabra TaxID=79078 RepID=A0ABU6RU79_9FABA|nr:hypothetical protein [Stylosanthes scabra]
MTLLLSWACHRIPACRPDGFEQRHFPLAERWIGYEPPRDREETRLRGWRRILNRLGITDVVWTPYADPLLQLIIPPWLVQSIDTWHVVAGAGGVVPRFPSGLGDEQDQLVQHVPLDLPVYDLPAPQLHQPEDGHLLEVRPRGGRQIRVRNRRGGRAGRGRGQGPEQEPAQQPMHGPVQDPVDQEPPVQEPLVHEPPVQEPLVQELPAASSAQAVAFTIEPASRQRIDSLPILHYSSATSNRDNFRPRAPIDAPFAATRSLFHHLRFYTTLEHAQRMIIEAYELATPVVKCECMRVGVAS